MSVVLPVLAGAVALVLTGRSAGPRRRLTRLAPGPAPPRPAARRPAGPQTRRRAVAGLAGLAVGLFVGGPVGLGAGLLVTALLPPALAQLPTEDPVAVAMAAELPLALDLMAAGLSAGAPVVAALAGAAEVVPCPLGRALAEVGAQLRLGADAGRAWSAAGDFPALAPLVAAMTRASSSGAAPAAALGRLAVEQRTRFRREQEAAVRRLEVFVVVPLGVCFLPAFVLVGVVPVVAGLATGLVP